MTRSNRVTVAQAAFGLMVVAALGKVLALFRELVVAARFGAGAELDAFLVGFAFPELLANLSTYVALTLFVPLYVAERQRDPLSAREFGSSFAGLSFLTLGVLAGVLAFFADPLVRFIGPALSESQIHISREALRWLSLVVIFRGLAGGLQGVANTHGRFWIPSFGGLAVSLAVIVLVLGFERLGIHALTAGTAIGWGVSLLLLIGVVRQVGGGFRLRSHPLLVRCLKRLPWIFAIEIAALAIPLIDRSLAGRFLPEGRISALAYAHIINEMPFQLFGFAIITTLYPEFAALAAKGDMETFQRRLRRALRVVWLGTFPVAVLLVFFNQPLIRAIYERGAFSPDATSWTASALMVYALGLPFIAAGGVLFRAGYAAGRFRTLLVCRLVALLVKVAVSLLLVQRWGHVGLALGTAAFHIVFFVLLLKPMFGRWWGWMPRVVPMLLGVGVAYVTAWLLNQLAIQLGWTQGFRALFAQGLTWSLAGLATALVFRGLKLESWMWIENTLRMRLGRKVT